MEMFFRSILLLFFINVQLINGYSIDSSSSSSLDNRCFNYCFNDGICLIEQNLPQCYCLSQWKGKQCQQLTETNEQFFQSDQNKPRLNLRDNPCTQFPNLCLNGGYCVFNQTLSCDCSSKYIGKRCEKQSPCNDYCLNNGNCTIKDEKAICVCPSPYQGNKCQTLNRTATPSPSEDPLCKIYQSMCENNSSCVINNGLPRCQCLPKYQGEFCETRGTATTNSNTPSTFSTNSNTRSTSSTNRPLTSGQIDLPTDGKKCIDRPCQNGGTCFNNGDSYKCFCPKPFQGANCQLRN